MTSNNDIASAAEDFQHVFRQILDRHAPIITYQSRKNYLPYLSQATKDLIRDKNQLFKEATNQGNRDLLKEAK